MTEFSDRQQQQQHEDMQNNDNDGSEGTRVQRSDEDTDAGTRLCQAIENIMHRDGATEVVIQRDPDVLRQNDGSVTKGGGKSWKKMATGLATAWFFRWLSTAVVVGFVLGVPVQVSLTWASLVYLGVYVVRWYVGQPTQKTVAMAEVVVWIGNQNQAWLQTQGHKVLAALGPGFDFRAGVPFDVDADPDVEEVGVVWTGKVASKRSLASSLQHRSLKPHWRLFFQVFLKPSAWLLVAWAGFLLGSICLMQHWHRFSMPHAGVWKVVEAAVDDYYHYPPVNVNG